MANRNESNPYLRNRHDTRNSRYSGSSHNRYGGGRRRFRFNIVNMALIAAIVIIGVIIGISLASPKDNPAGVSGTTSPAPLPTGTAEATATPGDGSQPTDSAVPDEGAATQSPAPTDADAAPSDNQASEYFTAGDVQTDDTTYKSADLYVKVTNVNKTGQNYYVADCRMKDSNRLFTAMATDTYVLHKEEKSSEMAKRKGAVIAINGDYFGAAASDRNDKGVVIRNGQLYRKTPWYDIAAIYNDGTMKTFGKSDITADQLIADGAVQAFNFGPMLLDGNGKAIPTDQLKLRPPKYNPANPRSGIGYIEPNHFVLVVVDGRGAGGGKGMTTSEFAKLFESLGCKSAYNLDGGGSATLVFMGKVINHPCDDGGERSVSDIIYFGESETDQANIDRMGNQ